MAKIIAVANQKGGTGKTTTALNLGAALAEQGKRVLLVDFDPQGALTLAHGIDPDGLETTIYDALINPSMTLASVLITTEGGPDLAPTNLDLSGAEVELLSEIGREMYLADKLRAVQDLYDVIIIDCPPTLGLLTINALAAADEVLIPVQTEYFALKAIRQLMGIIRKVQAKANPKLRIGGVLPTMYQTGTRHSQEVVAELEEAFKGQVYSVAIKKTVKFPDSVIVTQEDFLEPPQSRSMLRFEPRSEHAEAYRTLAREVLP